MGENTFKELYFKTGVRKHQADVRSLSVSLSSLLLEQVSKHDDSKLEEPELSCFVEMCGENGPAFGSDEYKECLIKIGVGKDHHYSCNRHHPEYFANGISDMNLIDILEMVCDWVSSSKRQGQIDVFRSLDICFDRFNIDPQLRSIIRNTVCLLAEKGLV